MGRCVNHTACIDNALQQADQICQDKGLNFTQLRRTVLTIIWQNHIPTKAYDLLDKLKYKERIAKPPTIYRTLDFLLKHGFIHKLNSFNAYIGCSHPLKHQDCYFLICTKCQEATEFYSAELTNAIANTTYQHNFTPHTIAVEIEGQCQNCQ